MQTLISSSFPRLCAVAVAASLTFGLVGCSDPKATIVPTDISQWDKELAPAAQKLSDEDKKVFSAYVARMKFVSDSKYFKGIEFGTTIKQALEEQRAWQIEFDKEEAIRQAKAKEKREREEKLKAETEAERAAAEKLINEAVTVTFIRTWIDKADYRSGSYSDYQNFRVAVKNESDKDIKGVRGEVVFYDLFDSERGSVIFTIQQNIKPGATYTWTGGRDYNEFMDEHKKIASLEVGKFTTKFVPRSILFADGKKVEMPK